MTAVNTLALFVRLHERRTAFGSVDVRSISVRVPRSRRVMLTFAFVSIGFVSPATVLTGSIAPRLGGARQTAQLPPMRMAPCMYSGGRLGGRSGSRKPADSEKRNTRATVPAKVCVSAPDPCQPPLSRSKPLAPLAHPTPAPSHVSSGACFTPGPHCQVDQSEWAEPVITLGIFVLVCLLVTKTFVGEHVDTTLATSHYRHLLEIVVGFSGTFWSLAELRKGTAQLVENNQRMAQLHKDMAKLRNDQRTKSWRA